MNIGQRLKNARTQKGLTQEKLSEIIGVSRQSISSWENDKSYPDIESLIKLSDIYDISLDVLLKEDRELVNDINRKTDLNKTNRLLALVYSSWMIFYFIIA